MRAVRVETAPTEMVGEKCLAEGDTRRLICLGQAGALPRLLGTLNDEGAHRRVEGIGMDLEEAVVALFEDEGEGIVELVRAEPDKARRALLALGSEGVGVPLARQAVHAVRRDQQVGIGTQGVRVVNDCLEMQIDAERDAPPLENVEQMTARNPREGMPLATNPFTLHMHIDGIPEDEGIGDLAVGRWVRLA